MAESVQEVVPETRPGGRRRGLDRLRASGTPAIGPADQIDQPAPAGTLVREAAPAGTPGREAAPAAEPQVAAPATVSPPAATSTPTAPTATSTPTATSPGASSASSSAVRGRSFRLLAAAIAVLVVLVGFLGYRLWHTRSSAQADKRHYEQLTAVDARNQAVLSSARQAAVTLLTYDYRHLDKDFAAVLNGSTGGFKKDFASKQTTAKTLFTQGKAVAGGHVLDAAVASSTPKSATVLVVIDQSVKNVSVPDGTTKHYRMQLKLDKVGSSWLVSDVEFPA